MANFLFQTTRNILCESGSAKRVGDVLLEHLFVKPASTILMVTDKGITSRALELHCLQSLKDCGFEIIVYDDVVADPPERLVYEAADLAVNCNVAAVVGFGGGSSMDVAKLVAFLAHPSATQTLPDMYGVNNCHGARLPLVQVPTTAGTGSEVTPISIITTGENEKVGVFCICFQNVIDCIVEGCSVSVVIAGLCCSGWRTHCVASRKRDVSNGRGCNGTCY